MSTPTPSLRLAAIKLCGYRGFPNPITVRLARHDEEGNITGKGKNLLLFGENGSGKSSFGKAIRDFLNSRVNAPSFDEFKYRHNDPPRTDRGVTLTFDDQRVDPLAWNPTDRDKAHPDFADMARSHGWLDYRVLWRATDFQREDSVDIFRPLVEEIITGCLPGTGGTETFGQTWAKIVEAAEKKPTRNTPSKSAVALLQSQIKTFNDSLETFLEKLQVRANDFLREFTQWTSLILKWRSGAKYNPSLHHNKFSLGSIWLQMTDHGDAPLKNPSEFLNEARLTAIGLCLYLAGMSQSIPPRRANGSTYPRLLVLDDVLLSLDMVHRMPLLKLLKSSGFKDCQILLMTHDRSWYEIAKQQLEGWAHHELFVQQVGGYEQPVLREDQDHLMQAIDFLHDGYVKAAAVHVRTKFELVLKWACQEFGLAVKYNPDPRKVSASDFWEALNGATFDKIPAIERKADASGNEHWWQPKPAEVPVVPAALKSSITHAVSWVLNPLSHSQNVDRYRTEIEEAIFAVNDLEFAVWEAVAMRQAGPVMLREMLLGMLFRKQWSTRITPDNLT
jgi:ABC-type dipeptide/oligopeptide/nickel transport system ATPase component